MSTVAGSAIDTTQCLLLRPLYVAIPFHPYTPLSITHIAGQIYKLGIKCFQSELIGKTNIMTSLLDRGSSSPFLDA